MKKYLVWFSGPISSLILYFVYTVGVIIRQIVSEPYDSGAGVLGIFFMFMLLVASLTVFGFIFGIVVAVLSIVKKRVDYLKLAGIVSVVVYIPISLYFLLLTIVTLSN